MHHNQIPAGLPQQFRYVCCDSSKRPYDRQWQKNGLTLEQVKARTKEPRFASLGVLCGPASGGLIILDVDGERGWELLKHYSGNEITPMTVTVEGSSGSAKMLFWAPESYWPQLRSVKDLVKAEGHDQGIEILWEGRQGIIAGQHPTAGNYTYWPQCTFETMGVQRAPEWLLELASVQDELRAPRMNREAFIQSLVDALSPSDSDDYETWVKVGMALQSEGDRYFDVWDRFSQLSSKYSAKEVQLKWRSFSESKAKLVTIGTLHQVAISRGWRPTLPPPPSRRTELPPPSKPYGERHTADASACQRDPKIVTRIEENLFKQINGGSAPQFPYDVFPEYLRSSLLKDAYLKSTDPINLVQYLLPAIASRMGMSSLNNGMFSVPNALWTMTVQESGGGKSRAYSSICKQLNKRQAEEFERFRSELKAYKGELARYKKQKNPQGEEPELPVLNQFLFDKATIQAVCRRIADLSQGALWARDELAGLFRSLNQFSKGSTEGLDILLESWNGGAINVARVHSEDSFFVENSRLSIVGGIQPKTYREIFSDSQDDQGVLARFLIAQPKDIPASFNADISDLPQELKALYKFLDSWAGGELRLSKRATEVFGTFYNRVSKEKTDCKDPLLRGWLSKFQGHVCRLAMVFHVLDCFAHKNSNREYVTASTLRKAISVGDYYRKVFMWLNGEQSSKAVPELLQKIIDYADGHPEGITPRDVYRNFRSISTRAKLEQIPQADFVKLLFSQLVDMGCGTIVENNNNSLTYKNRRHADSGAVTQCQSGLDDVVTYGDLGVDGGGYDEEALPESINEHNPEDNNGTTGQSICGGSEARESANPEGLGSCSAGDRNEETRDTDRDAAGFHRGVEFESGGGEIGASPLEGTASAPQDETAAEETEESQADPDERSTESVLDRDSFYSEQAQLFDDDEIDEIPDYGSRW